MGLTLQSVKSLSHSYEPKKRVSAPFFRSGQCACLHRCSGMVVEWSCFYLHPLHHRVVLSDVGVLCNCLCSTGERSGLAVRARPAPSCEGLLFSFLGPNCTCVYSPSMPLVSSRLSAHMLASQFASLAALSFLWFARSEI